MDRREFIKRYSTVAFVGSLAGAPSAVKAVEQECSCPAPYIADVSKKSTPHFDYCDKKSKIFNGQVFEAPYPVYHTVIVQYIGRGDRWFLLSDPYEAAQHGGSAMMVCYYERKDGGYNPFYTQEELQEKLKDWKLIEDKRLILDVGYKR